MKLIYRFIIITMVFVSLGWCSQITNNKSESFVTNYETLSWNYSNKLLNDDTINSIYKLIDNGIKVSQWWTYDSGQNRPLIQKNCAHVVVSVSNNYIGQWYCLGTINNKFLPAENLPIIPYFISKSNNIYQPVADNTWLLNQYFDILSNNNSSSLNKYISWLDANGLSVMEEYLSNDNRKLIYSLPYKNWIIWINYTWDKYNKLDNDHYLWSNIFLNYMLFDGRQYEFFYSTGESYKIIDWTIMDNHYPLYILLSGSVSTNCNTLQNDKNCINDIIKSVQTQTWYIWSNIIDFETHINKLLK